MKELSIEDKAKRYDEAIEIARQYYNDRAMPIGTNFKLERMFPELKESDDERIRKALIKFFTFSDDNADYQCYGVHYKNIVAWLERQEQHTKFIESIQIGDKVTRNKDGMLVNLSQLDRVAKKDEKQGEQKPDDKVEPKFHEGEWVVYDHRPYQIVELPKEGYINLGLRRNEKIEFAPSTYCRHWTIEDAKDGDVLTCHTIVHGNNITQTGIVKQYIGRKGGCSQNFECYVFNDWDDYLHFDDYMGSGMITPATKEQRDKLEKAMADAGYTFDFEKKELKKIEQNPAWDEGDEAMVNSIISFCDFKVNIELPNEGVKEASKKVLSWLNELKNRVQPQPKQEWNKEDEIMREQLLTYMVGKGDYRSHLYNWLESLKPQPKQDWSKEDEKMIENIIDTINTAISECDVDDIGTKARFSLEKERDWLKNRLKSLRPQSQWKPSEEMLKALYRAIPENTMAISEDEMLLDKLYQGLKYGRVLSNK